MKMQKEKRISEQNIVYVICFNKALSDDAINIITDRLKIYYPFT